MASARSPSAITRSNAPTIVIPRPGILCRRDRACVATVRFVTVHGARQERETLNLKGEAAGRSVFAEASTLLGSHTLASRVPGDERRADARERVPRKGLT